MYQFSYADIVEDSPVESRAREHRAIKRSIDMMRAAETVGMNSREATAALYATQQLWCLLIEDLARPENQLQPKLRADLISIGLWVLREVESLRIGTSSSFEDLIEVSSNIAEGLK